LNPEISIDHVGSLYYVQAAFFVRFAGFTAVYSLFKEMPADCFVYKNVTL
jgi:hypothetical protein